MTPTFPPDNAPLAITACALLTPLDEKNGAHETDTWSALSAGQRITTRIAVRDELLDPDVELDRSIRLALAAASRLNTDLRDADLFCGTSKGPAGTLLAGAQRLRGGLPLTVMQAEHLALGVGAMGTFLHDRLSLSGTVHTSVAACSSGLHALHRAASAIRRGECRRALVVAADASLHPLFGASFQRLGVLAPAGPDGLPRCDPFNPAGHGFFLIEAAAALILENSAFKIQNSEFSPPLPLAYLEHTAIAADSTALIAIDPAAATLRAQLRAVMDGPLAFVHAHATGTAHDAYELTALRAILGNDVPIFSHKQWLGHSLGAAGLVSVVLSVLSHHHGHTPGNIAVPPGARSLTIAQGFGGHIALAALRGPSSGSAGGSGETPAYDASTCI